MKKLKLLAMLGALGGVLLFGTGCNSIEQPIDENYTGTYSCYEYSGSMKVTSKTVSGEDILMPKFILNGNELEGYVVSWKAADFNYYSNQKFDFEADSTAIAYSGGTQLKYTGTHEYEGEFFENAKTYDIKLKYYEEKILWFAKNKPENSSNAVSYDYFDDDMDTYDVSLNADYDDVGLLAEDCSGISADDNDETSVLEKNGFTVSEDIDARDSIDEGAYAYDVESSATENRVGL